MPGALEPLVQDAPRRTHERVALDVLAVAGLLADQHQPGVARALAEHRLGGVLPELARSALLDRLAQRAQARSRRNRRGAGLGRARGGHVSAMQLPEP